MVVSQFTRGLELVVEQRDLQALIPLGVTGVRQAAVYTPVTTLVEEPKGEAYEIFIIAIYSDEKD